MTNTRSQSHNDKTEHVIQPTAFTPSHDEAKRWQEFITPKHVLLTLFFCSSLVIVWFLMTAKTFSITTQPATQKITVDGGIVFSISDYYLARSGDYNVSATATGYYPLQEVITLKDDEQNFALDFEPLPGDITINTPHSEAIEVWIDGERRGVSQERITNIAAGKRELSLRSERFLPVTETITIEGREQHQSFEYNLQPAWADVSFNTEPSGAVLTIDQHAIGTTPIQSEVTQGKRTISLSYPGYVTWQEELIIRARETLNLPTIALKKAARSMQLSSTPSNASVTLNQTYQGQTPLSLALSEDTTYQLTVFKEGYAELKRTLTSPQNDSLAVTLDPLLGKIAFSSQPKGALLYVDNRLLGRANQTLQLPATQHAIRIEQEGYEPFQTIIVPKQGQIQQVHAELRTAEQARWDNIPTNITSPAGQTLTLFRINQVFTMGSSRREQGRRANEAQRLVALDRAFYLGTHEVTNQQYKQFDALHSSSHVQGNSLDIDSHPVVNITWEQAALYCNWLSEQAQLTSVYSIENGKVTGFSTSANGYRLPTEAEWAWAARFENNHMQKFPWGSAMPPTKNAGNYADRHAASIIGNIQARYDDGHTVSAPVGSFQANAKKLYDLGGNVAEWIHDFYSIGTGLSLKTEKNPMGPTEGNYHVIRGSSWAHGSITDLRLSFRDYSADKRNDVGFRIARYVDESTQEEQP